MKPTTTPTIKRRTPLVLISAFGEPLADDDNAHDLMGSQDLEYIGRLDTTSKVGLLGIPVEEDLHNIDYWIYWEIWSSLSLNEDHNPPGRYATEPDVRRGSLRRPDLGVVGYYPLGRSAFAEWED